MEGKLLACLSLFLYVTDYIGVYRVSFDHVLTGTLYRSSLLYQPNGGEVFKA